jgi:hypothetical protein
MSTGSATTSVRAPARVGDGASSAVLDNEYRGALDQLADVVGRFRSPQVAGFIEPDKDDVAGCGHGA